MRRVRYRSLFEGSGKGDIGSVADLGGDAGHGGPLITQQGPGALHAQGEQVADDGFADVVGEPSRERGPGQPYRSGEAGHGPGSGKIGMHGLECRGDVRVSQT